MADVIRTVLLFPTPLWVTAALTLVLSTAVLALWLRQRTLTRILKRHARSIANMDDWADMIDERLERLDWTRSARPAVEAKPKKWMTG